MPKITMPKIKKTENQSGITAHRKLKILFTIVPREKADFYTTVLSEYDINLQSVLYGEGSVPSSVASSMHLTDTQKAVIISAVAEENIKDIMTVFEDKYFKMKNSKGIAFTVPMSSVIGVKAYEFLSYQKEE